MFTKAFSDFCTLLYVFSVHQYLHHTYIFIFQMTVALKILQNDYMKYFELRMTGGTFEYIRVTNKVSLYGDEFLFHER